jgi:hypothetical protein
MPSIRIAFFRGRTWSIRSWAIRLWTLSRFNHVEVILPDGRSLNASTTNGVIWRTLQPSEAGDWEIWSLPVTEHQLASISAFAAKELGCRYDWKGIFLSQFIRLHREDPERWFCSELSAAVIQQTGLLAGRRACGFSPGALRDTIKDMPEFQRAGGVGAEP